jgi:hypothetical protein
VDLHEVFQLLNPTAPSNVIDATLGFQLRRSIHEASKELGEPRQRDWTPPEAA